MSPAAPEPCSGERRWLSVAEACRYLSIGDTLLYKLIHAGELPERRIGRRLRFLTSDLDRVVVPVVHGASVRHRRPVA